MSTPSTIDFVHGVDFTGATSFSQAQLNQLVDNATLYTDKGIIITTTDTAGSPNVPAANTTTKWQNYFWRRVSTNSVTVYVWNTGGAGDPTLLNWVPITQSSIAPSSIYGSMLVNSTVTSDKIASVNISQVTGFTPSSVVYLTSNPAAGDISGSFTAGFSIGTNAVTSSKILAGAVTLAKLDTTGTQYQFLYNSAAGTPAWVTTSDITLDTAVTKTANGSKVPQVKSDASGYQMVAPTTLGRILQIVRVTSTNHTSTSGTLVSLTATPNYDTAGMTAMFNSGAFTKIDTTGASKLLIEVFFSGTLANAAGFVGLYNSNANGTAPLAGRGVELSGSATMCSSICFSYLTAANPANATYYVSYGVNSGVGYMNSFDGSNNAFGITASEIRITEYI